MKKIFISTLFLVAAFFLASCMEVKKEKDPDTTKILFVGNSYLYFNSLPQMVESIAQSKLSGHKVETKLISGGGMTLKQHWHQGRVQQVLADEAWDYVVLQEQSLLGTGAVLNAGEKSFVGSPHLFHEYARKFHNEISSHGAQSVFMLTWSPKKQPEQQNYLDHAYINIAQELRAEVAPVGLVWRDIADKTELNLYAADGSHPSPMGSYVAAATLFSTIFNENIVEIPNELFGNRLYANGNKSEQRERLVTISSADAEILNKLIQHRVESFRSEGNTANVPLPQVESNFPVLTKGEQIDFEKIVGEWYCASNSLYGLKMEINKVHGEWHITMTNYLVDKKDTLQIDNISFEDERVTFAISNPGQNKTESSLVWENEAIRALSKSHFNNFTFYNSCDFTKEPVQNGIDLARLDYDLETMKERISQEGYVSVMSKHWNQYADLTGQEGEAFREMLSYRASEELKNKQVKRAIEQFQLVAVLFPNSPEAFDNLAKAYISNADKENATLIFERAYELAKKNNHANIDYFKNYSERM